MKYFTYSLIPNPNEEEGGLIGPANILPENSRIGIYDGEKFYGSANVVTVAIINEFEPIEITKELFDRYAEPPPQITARQFYLQAEKEGFITKQEVKDALINRVIPQSIQNVLNTITDAEQKFNAEMLICCAIYFDRNNPLVEMIGTGFGKTTFEIDQFFRDASNI